MTVISRENGADYVISGQRDKEEAVLDGQFLIDSKARRVVRGFVTENGFP